MSLCHSSYNKASKVNEGGLFSPFCDANGAYKKVQCYAATGECWCVEKDGREIPETRRIGEADCESKGRFPTRALIINTIKSTITNKHEHEHEPVRRRKRIQKNSVVMSREISWVNYSLRNLLTRSFGFFVK